MDSDSIGQGSTPCIPAKYNGVWCNGSTKDFESLGRGSTPCTPARGQKMDFSNAVPQITKNYREFVENVINIGGELLKLNKKYDKIIKLQYVIIFLITCLIFVIIFF